MKLKLEEEKEKTKNITGYYEEIIQGYEDKLAVEKLKNSLLIAIAQLDDTDCTLLVLIDSVRFRVNY